ncbi:TPA: hypothetical protein ACKQDN_002366 [Serratia marcescens]
MYRVCAWLIIFICSPVRAAIIEGVVFSDWYLTKEYYHAIDFHLGSIALEPSDANGGLINCSGFGCQLEVRGTTVLSHYVSVRRMITPATSRPTEYTLDEFNRRLNRVMPWSGALIFNAGYGPAPNSCISVIISSGFKDTLLGSSCDGRLPPITKPPSVPLFCNVSGLSSDTVDFGELVQGRAASRSITASLGCNGAKDVIGKGRLLITDAARSGAATATLRNAQSGAEIKVRLSLGDENGSNEKRFDVKAGYQTDALVYFSLDAGETTNKSGHFSGSALLILDVL